jgi:thioredoxin-dependent peroxiredoxin
MSYARAAFTPWVAALGLLAAAVASAPARAELKVGDPAPAFEADAALAGEPFRFVLADALKKGPVVLYFYPKAFTQGCTIEANRFAEAAPDYAEVGATVVGISGDDIETLSRFSVTECRNRFAVASDRGGSIMKAYDARLPFSETYAKRVSYLISPQGRILHVISSMAPEEHVPGMLVALRQWVATPPGATAGKR